MSDPKYKYFRSNYDGMVSIRSIGEILNISNRAVARVSLEQYEAAFQDFYTYIQEKQIVEVFPMNETPAESIVSPPVVSVEEESLGRKKRRNS